MWHVKLRALSKGVHSCWTPIANVEGHWLNLFSGWCSLCKVLLAHEQTQHAGIWKDASAEVARPKKDDSVMSYGGWIDDTRNNRVRVRVAQTADKNSWESTNNSVCLGSTPPQVRMPRSILRWSEIRELFLQRERVKKMTLAINSKLPQLSTPLNSQQQLWVSE